MTTFTEQLRESAQKTGSIVCVGLDPVLERIPINGEPEEVITQFYTVMLDAFKEAGCLPGAVKPNFAFYEQYGLPGLHALENVIKHAKQLGLLVIGDAKRGDIDRTSAAYATGILRQWNCDAITVAPYMGQDSVTPFIAEASPEKGVYLLVRTSNAGAKDFQNIENEGTPLYRAVAQKLLDWHQPGLGAVVGATYPAELKELAFLFQSSGKEVPLLIPGVGKQGGTMQETVANLREAEYDLALCRINSSSGISYAYEKEDAAAEREGKAPKQDFAGAAVRELQRLHKAQGKLE